MDENYWTIDSIYVSLYILRNESKFHKIFKASNLKFKKKSLINLNDLDF